MTSESKMISFFILYNDVSTSQRTGHPNPLVVFTTEQSPEVPMQSELAVVLPPPGALAAQ